LHDLDHPDEGHAVIRAMWLVALIGCAQTSKIGPYVKNVERHGAELAVVTCELVFTGSVLVEGACSTQNIPLDTGVSPPGDPLPLSLPATAPVSRSR
jgi:hypothetical protein